MDAIDLQATRAQLIAREAELRAEVAAHREQLVQPDSATGNTFVAGTEGAVADASDERELALLARAQAELADVEAALRRIDSEAYGECESCGEPIAPARLRARPEARLCVACQEMAERGQGRAA